VEDRSHALAEEVRAYLLRAFDGSGSPPPLPRPPGFTETELQLAAAVLCMAVMRGDHECRQDEHRALYRAVEDLTGLGPDDTARLLRRAEEQFAASRSLHELAGQIRASFSRERKCRLLESLWRVAYADAELSGHEEYLVRKIADLLDLSTADLMEAKVRAREAFGRD
jgi:uncharacterized tellurite resistance protein B-like protein